ncbi:MAG: class I SAM-dependent methyltransferase [Acetobacteraceae bacterium]|nr:class I SAM-dependent methyltransferase [Acetobacteraceae bacterium]
MAAEPVSRFNARNAAEYERSMGRWSRRMAPLLVAFADIGAAASVLDVGCGTGSLLFELAKNPALTRIAGIDAADVYVAATTAKAEDARIDVRHGDAAAMPYGAGEFDAALSQLVLQFVPDPVQVFREMRRVTKPGGVVAAAVWNSYGGMPHQRMFWDIAAILDKAAVPIRNNTWVRPMTRRGDLSTAMAQAGLVDVVESALTIWMDFADFDDFWQPIAGGEGTLGKYALGLSAMEQDRLRDALRDSYCAGQPDGERSFACTAQVARAMIPLS